MIEFLVCAFPESESFGDPGPRYKRFESPDSPIAGDMLDVNGTFHEILGRYHQKIDGKPVLEVRVNLEELIWRRVIQDSGWKQNDTEALM